MTPNDTQDEIPSIVPERDELVQHRKQQRSSQAARNAGTEAPGRTSGTVVFFLTILFLGMCATGGAAWYFYQQGEQTKAVLADAAARLKVLETSLNAMDDSTKQSAMGLLQRVDTNFKEIDKLWADRNKAKVEMEKQGIAINAIQKTTNEHETALTTHGNQLSQHQSQLTSANNRIEQLSKSTAGLENLGPQMTTLSADVKSARTAQAAIDKRMRDAEQDIESMRVYRQQNNQTINEIKNNINVLQQAVKPPAGK
jgi:chromosome segregation ATPase